MSDTWTLVVLSASAAILHVLVPDHEIPLAMIGRAKNWGIKQMSLWTLIAGVIHISVSMAIGFIAVGVSMALAQYIANVAHLMSGGLLTVFGAVYAFFAWRGKHMHSHKHDVSRLHGESHDHPHPHGVTTDMASRGKSPLDSGGASMVAGVIGMAPCFTLIPVLIAAVPYGTNTIVWVMVAYAVATIGVMMVTANIMLKAITFAMRLTGLEKYLELTAGSVIFAVGVWLLTEDYLTIVLGL